MLWQSSERLYRRGKDVLGFRGSHRTYVGDSLGCRAKHVGRQKECFAGPHELPVQTCH